MDKKGRVHSKKYIRVYFIPMKGTMGFTAIQKGISVPGQKLAKRPKTRPTPKPAPFKNRKAVPTVTPEPEWPGSKNILPR
jgi:hypothetical protein